MTVTLKYQRTSNETFPGNIISFEVIGRGNLGKFTNNQEKNNAVITNFDGETYHL